jgi:uncharacterized membrane protein
MMTMRNVISISVAQKPSLRLMVISPFFIFLLFMLTSAVLSPYFETNLMVGEYELANSVLGKICHQYPSRCFYVFGSNMGLCARCFSVYSAMFILCILFVFFDMGGSLKCRSIIALSLFIPLLLDGITQYFSLRESNNLLRLLTGFLAGIGISIIFFPIYMVSTRNVTERIFRLVTTKGGLNYERQNR